MRCWCARCKVLVPVVHLERWVTGESGEGIVRGACAICGRPTGEIGVHAAPAGQRRSAPAWPERVPVTPSPHGRLRVPHDTRSWGQHRRDEQPQDGAGSGRNAVRIIAAPADDAPRPDADHRAGDGGYDLLPAAVRDCGLAVDLDPAGLP